MKKIVGKMTLDQLVEAIGGSKNKEPEPHWFNSLEFAQKMKVCQSSARAKLNELEAQGVVKRHCVVRGSGRTSYFEYVNDRISD